LLTWFLVSASLELVGDCFIVLQLECELSFLTCPHFESHFDVAFPLSSTSYKNSKKQSRFQTFHTPHKTAVSKNIILTSHFTPHIKWVLSDAGQVDVTYWFEGLCVKRAWDDNFAR